MTDGSQDPQASDNGELAFRQALADAVTTRMPFGKYGPQNYPPAGLPLCDLPYEYLEWFRRKGLPTGRLGELMGLVLQIKRDGAEDVFDALRGNRPKESLRKPRRTSWTFGED